MINIKQFQAFHAVMVTGSTVGAAELLNTSQPAVSRLITDLEYRLGFALFERTRRRLRATPEAMLLLPEVNRWFDGLRSIDAIANDIKHQAAGFLRVASIPAVINTVMIRSLAEMNQANRNLKIDVSQARGITIHQQLRWNQVDVGIAGLPFENADAVLVASVNAPCVCVLPAGHPLAEQDVVAFADIAGLPQIAYVSDLVVQKRIETEFQVRGLRQNIICSTPQSQLACMMVHRGMGISILEPFCMVENVYLDIVARKLESEIEFGFGIFIAREKTNSHIAREFAHLLARNTAKLNAVEGLRIIEADGVS